MITINGQTFAGDCSNLTISGNSIIINGSKVSIEEAKVYNISVDGNVENLSADVCSRIVINGTAGNVETVSGDINCGNVTNNVSTISGDVECGNIGGNVKTVSGDINGCDK